MATLPPDFDARQAVAAVVSDALSLSRDPKIEARARDARQVVFYAGKKAEGDSYFLRPWYKATETGNAEDPFQDVFVGDPTADLRVEALARDTEALLEVRQRLFEMEEEASRPH